LRQQYHSRLVNGERLIWDVNRLVAITKGFPVYQIPLENIKELDEDCWYGDEGSSRPTCRNVAGHAKLIQETDLVYPIILCSQGRVMDGMHRVCKAAILGHKKISAVKFEQDPAPDHKNVSLDDLPYND
jgi:hypothetical protein